LTFPSSTRHSRSVSGPVALGYTDGILTSQETLAGGTEISDSINHGGYPELLGSGANIGGPWLMTRDIFSYEMGKITGGRWIGSDTVITQGPLDQPHPSPPSDSSQYALGSTALSRSWPTNPTVDGLQDITDSIKDGIPSLIGVHTWRHRTHLANSAGSEYLNVEFGWLPLVSDIRKFAHAVKHHSQIMADLHSGSGKSTRIGYAFPGSSSSSMGEASFFLHKGGNTGNSTVVSGSWFKSQETTIWFKGACTYLMPASDSQLGRAHQYYDYANRLLGIAPTPANIWQAEPWTWALDWFTNAGDIVNNLATLHSNSMVLNYGYLMTHVRSVDSISTTGIPGWSPCSRTHVREFKKRMPATPYGFGISDGDLSSSQIAVIAALGLSHFGGGHG
jgi:hypothetical protein